MSIELVLIGFLAVVVVDGSLCAEEPFVRGDVDGNGLVTLADAVRLSDALVGDQVAELPCEDAADFTDNGLIQLGDVAMLLEHVIKESPVPPAPFPAGGSDPTPDDLDCRTRNVPPRIEDADSIYDVRVAPAGGQSGHYRVSVDLESSVPVVGGSLTIDFGPSWPSDARVVERAPTLGLSIHLPTDETEDSVLEANFVEGSRLRIVWLLSVTRRVEPLPPGSHKLLSVTVCSGSAEPGTHELSPVDSHIISGSHEERLVGTDVEGFEIARRAEVCDPPFPTRRDVRGYAWMGDVTTRVGATFRASFFGAVTPSQQVVKYSLRWDSTVLKIVGAENIRGGLFEGEVGNYGPFDPALGNGVWHTLVPPQGLREGLLICDPCNHPRYSWGRAAIRLQDYVPVVEPRAFYPPDTEFHHFDLTFEVLPSASIGLHAIEFFEDPITIGSFAADNSVRLCVDLPPECNLSFPVRPLIDGRVEVLPAAEGEPRFIRGDIDRDGALRITDPVRLLGFLFSGIGPNLPCDDAADANDDGALNVADAVRVLDFLFSGADALPPPFPASGVDETEDGLACRR